MLASIREFAPFVTAIVLAGVAGTAITADLGARKIREELDALQVLGVDPVKNLVVPRFLALMLVTGLFDIYALLFGIFGGVVTTIVYDQPLGPFFATFFDNASVVDLWGSVLKCTLFGAIIAVVCCYKGMTASGGAQGVGRAVNQAVVIAVAGRVRVQLRVHADAPGHPPGDREPPLSRGPAGGTSHGPHLARRAARLDRLLRRHRRASPRACWARCFGLRVFRFLGEALRQAGILILSSTLVIWGLVFIIGLQCGIEAAYFNRAAGTPAYAGVFAAWCDLRELVPYAFGYMMAAKVGTGIVAEIGSMRISDEVDALEVMGISSMTFLCATRLLAAWIVLPFMYLAGIGAGYLASYLAVVQQIGEVSSGGFFMVFWMFQNPPDLLIQPHQGHGDGDRHRAGRLLLRLHRVGRPGRGGHGDREVDGAQPRAGPPDRHAGHPGVLGREPAGADRGLSVPRRDGGRRPRSERPPPWSSSTSTRRSAATTSCAASTSASPTAASR